MVTPWLATYALVLPLGVVAGALTTIAGIGGGLVITLVLAVAWEPHAALAVSAPALLMGNAHRLWLLRAEVDRRAAVLLAGPALVGALVGGLVAAALPDAVLRWLLIVVTVLAILRELGYAWLPSARPWLVGGGVLVGITTATSGAGGLLLAPLMLAAGLRGLPFIATGAVVGTTMHVAQGIAFGSTGMLGPEQLPVALVLGVAILAGNVAGRRLRPRLGERASHRLTWGTLLAGIVLAVAGVR
jgi:uncharacterized membrane protein YfcA